MATGTSILSLGEALRVISRTGVVSFGFGAMEREAGPSFRKAGSRTEAYR